MESSIIRQFIQQSHSNNAILSMRSDWSNYYVCGVAFDVTLAATFAPSLNLTTNPVVEPKGEATRSLMRKLQGEGKPTIDIRFHVPASRERGEKTEKAKQ